MPQKCPMADLGGKSSQTCKTTCIASFPSPFKGSTARADQTHGARRSRVMVLQESALKGANKRPTRKCWPIFSMPSRALVRTIAKFAVLGSKPQQIGRVKESKIDTYYRIFTKSSHRTPKFVLFSLLCYSFQVFAGFW